MSHTESFVLNFTPGIRAIYARSNSRKRRDGVVERHNLVAEQPHLDTAVLAANQLRSVSTCSCSSASNASGPATTARNLPSLSNTLIRGCPRSAVTNSPLPVTATLTGLQQPEKPSSPRERLPQRDFNSPSAS
ncbi:MAG: hypothetical protein CM1200mP29_04020 [Verrucomicrobiota bacterium]|nr:MAG: hypothetical protein CM1200mP29_04020 [Verrucomicrobiota bacterium]